MTDTQAPLKVPVELIEDAANLLACRGWWEPDDDDAIIPDDLVAELTEIALAPCALCATPAGHCRMPDEVVEHFMARKQQEYERSLPTWACECGRVYKVLAPEQFYELGDDGLLGDAVGHVRRNTKGQVKHTDKCRGCGQLYADVIARQQDPQQSLF